MNDNVDDVIQVMKKIYNRDISHYDESFLMKSLSKRLPDEENNTYFNYGMYLSENSNEAQVFLNSLNITYSEFFRNPLTFALLEQLILPSIMEEKKKNGGNEIRIWSSACAGGQEAYSIAIMLDELSNLKGGDINYRIFATDISEFELEKAKRGIYDFSTVQKVQLKHLNNYFTAHGETYQIIDKLKDKIEFSIYDLLDDSTSCPSMSIYGDFDLIMCSNVLFYFQPDIRQQILKKIYHCMSNSGYLITGEVEREIVVKNNFFNTVYPAAGIFRRRNY